MSFTFNAKPIIISQLGNKQQNNHLVIAETVRHSSTYIILYLLKVCVYNWDDTQQP